MVSYGCNSSTAVWNVSNVCDMTIVTLDIVTLSQWHSIIEIFTKRDFAKVTVNLCLCDCISIS